MLCLGDCIVHLQLVTTILSAHDEVLLFEAIFVFSDEDETLFEIFSLIQGKVDIIGITYLLS